MDNTIAEAASVPPAVPGADRRRGQAGGAGPAPAEPGVHAGRRGPVLGDRQGPADLIRLHLPREHRRDRDRWLGRAEPGLRGPRGGPAGHGGEGGPLQDLRQRGRGAALSPDDRSLRNHPGGQPASADLRRLLPGGHLLTPLLHDRGPPAASRERAHLPQPRAWGGGAGAGGALECAAAGGQEPGNCAHCHCRGGGGRDRYGPAAAGRRRAEPHRVRPAGGAPQVPNGGGDELGQE